jgi:hypothetical protein
MHDDNLGVMCSARLRELWENPFDNSDEVSFLPRKFRLVPVQHGHPPFAFQLKTAIPGRRYQSVDGGFTPSNARVFRKPFSFGT